MTTAFEHIVQRAQYWRETEKALLAAKQDEQAQMKHHDAKRQLRVAVDLAEKLVQP